MVIGERDWETEFFVGDPPRSTARVDEKISLVESSSELSEEKKAKLVKNLVNFKIKMIDSKQYEGLLEILLKLNT